MSKLKRTNTNAFKATVFSYLVDSVNSDGVKRDEKQVAALIYDRFEAEHNHEFNRQRYGNIQDRVSSWLQGIPFGIDVYSSGILKTAKEWHDVETLTPKQQEMIVDRWFHFLAVFILRLLSKHGYQVTL